MYIGVNLHIILWKWNTPVPAGVFILQVHVRFLKNFCDLYAYSFVNFVTLYGY